ncbi:hypothetical protein BDV93DRAFT_517997 [Ceratobasidium sp. AG-I]|nr:hypothetical protein BDV93DRAFT_517997 [Ceratobasidium sp. AG-I]
MSHPNRAHPRSGGIPSTSGNSLLGTGLSSSGNMEINSDVIVALGKNTIFANLSYKDKLQIIGTLLQQSSSAQQSPLIIYLVGEDTSTTKIREHLSLTHRSTISPYVQPPNTGLNSVWFEQLRGGLAIVPHSALLLALSHGLLTLSSVSHLVVDNAHSIALDDISAPIAAIFLEYYGPLASSSRPIILGLTHYPLHLEANFGQVALRMEQLLDARIFGDVDARRASLAQAADRLRISVLDYPALQSPENSVLLPEGQYNSAMKETLKEIGGCCGLVLSQFGVDIILETASSDSLSFKAPLPDLTTGTSTKLDRFLQLLQEISQTPGYRSIIIASNPFTVLALGWILAEYQPPGIHTSVYLAQAGGRQTSETQSHIIKSFTTGSVNTLICSDSIFNDMDEGMCSHVVWFNPHGSLIAFAQSRRFTRDTGANLVIMAERGNREHYRAARDILYMDPLVSAWVNGMDDDGAPIPPVSLAHSPRFGGPPIFLNPSGGSDQEDPYITDPLSGSRIYPKDAVEVLYRYLASQSASDTGLVPVKMFTYERDIQAQGLWSCTVNAPDCDPPLLVTSDHYPSKAAARGSACFKACSARFDLGLLPSSFFPLPPMHTLPNGVPQRGHSEVTPASSYPFASPLFWHSCLLAAPSSVFYPNVVTFSPLSGSHALRSMVFLTRAPLFGVEPFSVFVSQSESKVSLLPCAPLTLSVERIELVFRYSMHLWRAITNKPWESPSGELAYFVCPVSAGSYTKASDIARTTSVEPLISWEEIDNLVSRRARPLHCATPDEIAQDLAGGMIQDRSNEFTRRLEAGQLCKDLNPLSLVMKEQESGPDMSLLDYYKTHRHDFEGIKDLKQPLIQAQFVPGLANWLDPKETATEVSKNYLVPEMCFLSSIPAATFHTALIMPSVIWHVENVLVAKQLNLTLFQGQIRDDLLMHALCSQMAKRTFNYERLEFLGDTFIKYAASAYLYGTDPDATAGTLHMRRQRMVNNKSLWTGAQAIGLPSCIQSEPFKPRQWSIPNACIIKRERIRDPVPGGPEYIERLSSKVFPRPMFSKVIADVVEAIIGAALVSGGERLAFSAAKTLGFDVPKTCDWRDVVSHAPSKTTKQQEPDDKAILKGIMKIIGGTLEDPSLLLQAMHHPSSTDLSESYERLEFLGDAVLDMIVVQSFFADEEKWSPHSMTMIKSSMVSNRVLAIICVESGLYRFLLHNTPHLTHSVKSFVEELEACKRDAQNDLQRLKYWSNLQAPKALGDVVESLLGAVYVSSGFKLSRVKSVYERVLQPFYDRYTDKKNILSHPMSRLMAKLESSGCKALGVSKMLLPAKPGKAAATKCEVKIHGRPLAEATANNPKRAITLATEEALLRLDLKFDYIMNDCTCNNVSHGQKRKRADTEEGEIAETLLGGDAEHPIDVDMFDF